MNAAGSNHLVRVRVRAARQTFLSYRFRQKVRPEAQNDSTAGQGHGDMLVGWAWGSALLTGRDCAA